MTMRRSAPSTRMPAWPRNVSCRESALTAAPSQLDQAFAHRVHRSLRPVDDADLLVDVAHVVADGLLADLQPVGDLLVGKAGGHELQDLELAHGHAVELLLGRT